MKTFLELKQAVAILAQRVTYNVDGVAEYDDVFLTQAGIWLQLSEKLLAEIYDYWIELQGIYNFNSVDIPATEAYSMPTDFDKPLRVYDLTNKKEINPITEEVYSDDNIANIANAITGTPNKYRIFGVVDRRKQMKLGLIPDAVISYRVLYKKVPTGMSADGSYAFIDADTYLIFSAYGYTLKQSVDEQGAIIAWQKAGEALNSLLNNQMMNLSPKHIHKITSNFLQRHRI